MAITTAKNRLGKLLSQIENNREKVYRQDYTHCSKENCPHCMNGPGHGPYWFLYELKAGKIKRSKVSGPPENIQRLIAAALGGQINE